MARTTLTVQSVTIAGITPTYGSVDQANGNQFANTGAEMLHVKNTGGSPCTVTITAPAKLLGVSLTAPTVSVPATTGDKMIGPFPPGAFTNTDGMVYVDYSTGTGVTIAVIKH